MTDILIRTNGRAGHITLNRPKALNALTWDMCLAIEAALDQWQDNPEIALILIDGAGDRAFCSGGDIAEMYASGRSGDLSYGRNFWRDEYRLNAKIANYAKPVVTFLHGFTMGGGVGIGCHASHRIVCENSQIAMPECSIGLIPDVGGTLLLANAPGFTGTFLGLTGDRMDAGDALYAGFADLFIPASNWTNMKTALIETGDLAQITQHPPPKSRLQSWQSDLDTCFSAQSLAAIAQNFTSSPPLLHAKKLMERNSPLAMAAAIPLIDAARKTPTIEAALDMEFRFTYRAVEKSDFIEGIRAAIIDRDRTPAWKHADWASVTNDDISEMIAPLGNNALDLSGVEI